MKVGIDIRPLMGGNISGVEKYIVSMLQAIFEEDKENEYTLWYNAFSSVKLSYLPTRYPNVKVRRTRWPNKMLNLCLSLLRWPKIDRLMGKGAMGKGIEVVWIPDPPPAPVSKRCRKIITFHDLSFEEYKNSFNRKTRLWHRLLRPKKEVQEAWRIIAVSHFTRNKLATLYHLPASKIRVIHEAVPVIFENASQDARNIPVRQKYQLEKPYFLCLSTLDPRKNIQGAIKAYLSWKEKTGLPVELVIAGKARPDIFASSPDTFPEGVRWIGFVEECEKKNLYKEAIAFLYPSFYEGFGLPILEAMEAGTPVIASNAASMPEVAGKAALMVDPKKTEQIEEAMQVLFEDQALRGDLIEKGKRQVKSFSWQWAAKEFLEILKEG